MCWVLCINNKENTGVRMMTFLPQGLTFDSMQTFAANSTKKRGSFSSSKFYLSLFSLGQSFSPFNVQHIQQLKCNHHMFHHLQVLVATGGQNQKSTERRFFIATAKVNTYTPLLQPSKGSQKLSTPVCQKYRFMLVSR